MGYMNLWEAILDHVYDEDKIAVKRRDLAVSNKSLGTEIPKLWGNKMDLKGSVTTSGWFLYD